MLSIYAVDINQEVSSSQYHQMLSLIPDEKRQRIDRFHFKKDTLCSLYGDILIRYISSDILKIDNQDIYIQENRYGKPYLKDLPLHFNLSHSGHWVIAAISNDIVGVDIEKINDIDLNIAERFFTNNECLQIFGSDSNSRQAQFFSIWTLKESYIKFLGTGLSTPLNSFEFTVRPGSISLSDSNQSVIPRFKQYDFDHDYMLSVCTLSDTLPAAVGSINIGDAAKRLALSTSRDS